MNPLPENFTFPVIGVVRSCYRAKFGIPRQPGLVSEAKGKVCLLPPYNQPNTVRGLEDFSHLWLLFVFHESCRENWKATVRPPRLGGDKRIGVFASRSPFRPAPIGLSVVRLNKVIAAPGGRVWLEISGHDLLDGTPVLDIKPYLPYADIVPEATGGFAPQAPEQEALQVMVAPTAEADFARLAAQGKPELKALACKVLAQDPRPAYQKEPNRVYSIFLDGLEIVWQTTSDPQQVIIIAVRKDTGKKQPYPKPLPLE